MKHKLPIFTAFIALLASTAVVLAETVTNVSTRQVQSTTATATKQAPEMLFTQTAPSVTLEAQPGKERWYTLTLQDVNPETLWFSERPDHLSGTMSITDFIRDWPQGSDSFSKDHPNANLVAIQEKNGVKAQIKGVFVLADPVYDAKQKTLTYKAYSIYEPFHKNIKNETFQHVALFVDGNCSLFNPAC